MSEELDQLVQSVGIARPGAVTQGGGRKVRQQPDAIRLRADLPGLRPEDVDVSVDDGVLTIRGERRQEETAENDGFVLREVVCGTFFRKLPLPEGAAEVRVSAKFRDGVLEITVPVQAREGGRRIPVES